MATEAQRLGITPYVLRLAAYYACLGVGTYQPPGHPWFDRVEVLERMPWQANPDPLKSALILAVEFYAGKHRQRFVEFALTPAGFGGDPIVKVI